MRPGKIAVLFIIAAVFFVFTQASYSQNFEGKVSFTVYDEDVAHPMEYLIKGSKIRFDADEEGQRASIVMDGALKQFMIIMPDQKMYMDMSIPDAKMESDEMEGKDKEGSFVKTGETKEILGLTAEKWIFKSGDDQGEAWMAKGIGSFKLFDNPMNRNKPEWQKEIIEEGYFPLQVYDNGKKVYEVTGIEKKSLDNSMFEPPADFKKMDVPNMQK